MQAEILGIHRQEDGNNLTAVGAILGVVVFLLLGYLFLTILIMPFLWFRAYLELEETKAERSRKVFREKIEELSRDGKNTDWISPYKNLEKKGIRRITQSQLLPVSLEWLMSWGVFLALQGFWAYSLYKGFEFIMTNVGEVLENWFYNE